MYSGHGSCWPGMRFILAAFPLGGRRKLHTLRDEAKDQGTTRPGSDGGCVGRYGVSKHCNTYTNNTHLFTIGLPAPGGRRRERGRGTAPGEDDKRSSICTYTTFSQITLLEAGLPA